MAAFTQLDVSPAFGTLLAGSWLNTILFSLEGFLVWDRLVLGGSDALWVQAALLAAFASDGACTASQVATSWADIISHWGESDFVNVRPASVNVFIATTGFTGLVFHAFQLARGAGMVRARALQGAMAVVLGLLTVGAFGTCIYAAASKYVAAGTNDTGSSVPNTVWLSATAGLNVVLLVVLVPIYAARRREQVRAGEVEEVGRAWIATSWFIQAGGLGTVVSVLMLVLSFAVDQSNSKLTRTEPEKNARWDGQV